MELRTVGSHEVDLIENLFQEVYNREQGLDYWRWCFENPHGYVNSGMFERNRLVGYYACNLTPNSGCMVSAMVDPKFRRRDIFTTLSKDLTERIGLIRAYVYHFANKRIRNIHTNKCGFQEAYQIKEYRIPFHPDDYLSKPQKDTFFFTDYEIWRYRNHPFKKYIFHSNEYTENMAIFNIYEDRVQIVDYRGGLFDAKDVGMYIAKAHDLNYVSFWSQVDYIFPSDFIPVWKQYKILQPLSLGILEILNVDELRMGQSDVF